MRDKIKASNASAPSNLSADGMDAWFFQQKQREQEMKRRRQEAEALLRGYRMTMSHDRSTKGQKENRLAGSLAPVRNRLFDKGMATVTETMEDPNSDAYETKVGKLNIQEKNDLESPKAVNESGDKRPVLTPLRAEPTVDPAVKQRAVPTPARPMVPDETAWREFVEPGEWLDPKHTEFVSWFLTAVCS